MAEVVRMPKLSDTMTEGVVAEWHKKEGDKVETGEVLAEIETDKATMEFESFQEGTLLYQGIKEGEAAPVDSILAILGEEGEDISDILEAEKKKGGKEEKEPEKKEEKREEKPAEKKPAAEEKPAVKAAPAPERHARPTATADGKVKASPLARKLAEEKAINLSLVQGTGDAGRIIKRDIESFIGGTPAVAAVERYHDEPVSQMRKTIAKRLAESKFSAPHFYLTLEIDMDNAMNARKSINEVAPAKISFNDIVVKAAATALKQHPQVNASWLEDKIRFNEHVHVGVAVAVDEGLLVPVIKFADGKSLSQISTETKEAAEKARSKKLQPEDWEGNTFTISNLGMFGIEEFTAIINPPDSCIMAVGGIKETPVVKNGQIVLGNVMKVTLSCDHRVVDGATGAAFLQTFKKLMENPVVLLGIQQI